ncbi:MAG: hypothetical protein RL222_1737 [Bacteroidota bacterium]|jgi:hypothetical protein
MVLQNVSSEHFFSDKNAGRSSDSHHTETFPPLPAVVVEFSRPDCSGMCLQQLGLYKNFTCFPFHLSIETENLYSQVKVSQTIGFSKLIRIF